MKWGSVKKKEMNNSIIALYIRKSFLGDLTGFSPRAVL